MLRSAFPQVEEAQAEGELAQAYAEMRDGLRVPWVMFAARALACFGDYVPRAWARSRPVFATRGLEAAADAIRAQALLPEPGPPDLNAALARAGVSAAEVSAVRDAARTLHYGNAKYLLLITAWSEALHGRPSGGASGGGWDSAPLPAGLPPGMPALQLIDPRQASDAVLDLLDRIVDAHLHHGPASDFRVLARWPRALEVIHEEVLAPVVRGAAYDERARDLYARARRTVAGFPSAAGLSPAEAGEVCTDTERAAATAMLSMFQRFILDVTIDMARVVEALDGREAAARNPFPPSG